MVYLDPTSATGLIYGMTILVAMGTCLSKVTGYIIAPLALQAEETGAGLSLQNVSQIGEQIIALAIASQIYQSVAIKDLSVALPKSLN